MSREVVGVVLKKAAKEENVIIGTGSGYIFIALFAGSIRCV